MTFPLAPVFLAVSAAILLWDVFLSGEIAQLRRAPRLFRAVTGLVGLLVLPALFVAIAGASIITGRVVNEIGWLWPFTLVLFAIQAWVATGRRLVVAPIGVPIALYDTLVAAVAIARHAAEAGTTLPAPLLSLVAAERHALALVLGPLALSASYALLVPILAPAYPARWGFSATVRGLWAGLAAASTVAIATQVAPASAAIASYARYDDARLQERPRQDFGVGVRLFPVLTGAPAPIAVRSDLALVDSLQPDLVAVMVASGRVTNAELDSVARSLDERRQGGMRLAVFLAPGRNEREALRRSADVFEGRRLASVEQVVRRLRPDLLFPALDPFGVEAAAIGRQPVDWWQRYLWRAAAVAHREDPAVKVGLLLGTLDVRDSALYAWATAAGAPLDAVGILVTPGPAGARSLETRTRTATRWMTRPLAPQAAPRPHWILAGAYPLLHGERAQERALWGTIAWATSMSRADGVIVLDAGDYDRVMGLRTSGGRLRRATGAVGRAVGAIRGED